MPLSFDVLINAFITLFVMVDPIGNMPIFLGLTAGMTAIAQRMVALRASIVAFFILALFALSGMSILNIMGITIDAFRVAGGLFLMYTAFEMLYAKRQERKEKVSEAVMRDQITNLAIFPIAIPLLAGPGAISAVIILSSQLEEATGSAWQGKLILLGIIFTLMLLSLLVMGSAQMLNRFLGETGRTLLTRLLGVLLAALAVQYVADGIKGLF